MKPPAPTRGDRMAEAWRPLPGEHPQGLERQVRGSRAGTGPRHLPMPSPEHVARATAEGEDAVNLLVRETKRAQIEAARRDPRSFIEYVFGIQQQWFHDEWQALLDHAQNALIIAPRGHGKCVPDDGLVTLADGSRVRAADLPEFFDALSWSEGTGWVSRPAHRFADQVQPIIEIRTRSGRLLRLSPEHPVWTGHGWVPARNVTVGDAMGTTRGAVCAGGTGPGADVAWMLGLLLGDGGLTQPSRVNLTCADDNVIAEARRCCDALGWTLRNRTPASPGIEWSITGGGVLDLLRSLGLHGVGAHGKRVPSVAWSWPSGDQAALLCGLLESDGSATRGRAGDAVELWSVSEGLMRDAQSLLLRIGVSSRVAIKRGRYKGQPHLSWRTTITGSAIDDLRDVLPARGPRSSSPVLRDGTVCHGNDRADVVPEAVIDRLLPVRMARGAHPRLDNRRRHGQQRWKVINRARQARVPELERAAELGWDQVVSVTRAAPERTWSIEVEGTHAVIVDDIVTHNTTQIIGRLLWEFGKNPNLRVKLVCASDSKANERVQEIREHIGRNPRVKEVFPHLRPAQDRDWTKRKLTLERTLIQRDVSLEALGIGSSVTGGRADMLIFDDICDERNTLRFPELREQIKRTFKAAFAPVLEPDGRTWYVCTLYHEADNSHELIRGGRYLCDCHRDPDDKGDLRAWDIIRHDVGIPGDKMKPLWPRVWNRKRLEARHLKIGSVEFDRAYRNMPQSESTQIVPASWIVYDEPPPNDDDLITFQAYDLADGENKKGDAFAGVTIGTPTEWPPGPETARWAEMLDMLHASYDDEATVEMMMAATDWGPRPVWVLSAFAERIPFGDQVRRIISEWVEWGAVHVGIEKVTCEGVSAQIQREPGAPIIPIVRLRPVRSKARRLTQVAPLVQSGRVRFSPHLDPDRNPELVHAGDVVSELRQFPIAKHDDLVDAFVYALLLLLMWERVTAQGAREEADAVGVRVIGAPRVTGTKRFP